MNKEKMKIRVALLFGGKSAEHEVSLLSARNIYQALDPARYEVTLVGITHAGQWVKVSPPVFLDTGFDQVEKHLSAAPTQELSFEPNQDFYIKSEQDASEKQFDVVLPTLHGSFGEDGSLQGFCRMLDIPFVGPSVLGSAVGMDKDVMKRLLREAKLPVAKAIVLKKHEAIPSFTAVQEQLGKIVFVKPANLGSSVGVSRVTTEAEYRQALEEAFLYDTKILIEEEIKGREIECSVLGNEFPEASLPGEVITDHGEHAFYSYEAKYLDEKGATVVIPAHLTAEQIQEVKNLSVSVFQALCCEGMGRVDFFLKPDGNFVVNEINTLPGFTSISMYPKLWEASGLKYNELIDKLIALAIERYERDARLKLQVK